MFIGRGLAIYLMTDYGFEGIFSRFRGFRIPFNRPSLQGREGGFANRGWSMQRDLAGQKTLKELAVFTIIKTLGK